MTRIVAVLTLFFVCCKHQPNDPSSISDRNKKDSALYKYSPAIDSLYKHADSVVIALDDDTLGYSKDLFKAIVDSCETLYSKYTPSPSSSFSSRPWFSYIDSNGKKQTYSFSSEVGEDQYYILYAWFLHHHDTSITAINMRKKFLSAMRSINDMFGMAVYGGTYYGHQHRRINGFAAYAAHNHPSIDTMNDWTLEHSINLPEQKKQFIDALRQELEDILKSDPVLTISEKKFRLEQRNSVVEGLKNLDTLITDLYTLRTLQEFRYTYYSWL